MSILRRAQRRKVADGYGVHNDPKEEKCLKGVEMAKKLTKADKAQRQADHLEKKADARPERAPKKPSQNERSEPGGSPVVSH